MLMNLHEAAATALVGVDLARNERQRSSSQLRILKGVAVVGSAVVDDFSCSIYIENFYVGRFRNTHAGVLQVDSQSDVIRVGPHAVPPGAQISVICDLAATTNPINVQLH